VRIQRIDDQEQDVVRSGAAKNHIAPPHDELFLTRSDWLSMIVNHGNQSADIPSGATKPSNEAYGYNLRTTFVTRIVRGVL